jgi:hypothetical protein
MYSNAASLNSVTVQGATALSSWQTLRMFTEEMSVQIVKYQKLSVTHQTVLASSDKPGPVGQP